MEGVGREGGIRRWKEEEEGTRRMKRLKSGLLRRSWSTGSSWFCCAGLMREFVWGIRRGFMLHDALGFL